jgi:hypothetical protein
MKSRRKANLESLFAHVREFEKAGKKDDLKVAVGYIKQTIRMMPRKRS